MVKIMASSRVKNLIGVLLLLGATIAWGTSFVILKETIAQVPAFYVISIRFLVATAGLSLIFIKKIRAMDKKTFIKGMILGGFLAAAYLAQTIGLKHTTPGRNAFLTSTYCVSCPFLIWLLFKKKPKFYNVLAAVLCIVGVGLIALSGEKTGFDLTQLLLGDGLTLISSIFFGFQIIFIDKFQKDGCDSVRLLVPELLTAGIITGIVTLCFELPFEGIGAYALNVDQLWRVAYLTVACTLFAQFAQITGQKFTSPNQCAIILSLESVFGVAFSVAIGFESLTVYLIIGFVVIFASMMISELHLDPIKLFKRKSEKALCENQGEKIKESD